MTQVKKKREAMRELYNRARGREWGSERPSKEDFYRGTRRGVELAMEAMGYSRDIAEIDKKFGGLPKKND